MRSRLLALLWLCSTVVLAGELAGPLSGRLKLEHSPYLIHKDIRIEAGDSLAIDAGVVMKFDSTVALKIDGRLTAAGEPERPVLLTSSRPAKSGAGWEGVVFSNRSDNKSAMTYCRIESARRGISVFSCSPTISHCVISRCSADGLLIRVSAAQITANTISENGKAGIHATAFRGTIADNFISENRGDGLGLERSAALIVNNTIARNGDDGLFVVESADRIHDNRILQNKDDAILLEGGRAEIWNNLLVRSMFGIFGYKNAKPVIANNTIAGHLYGLYARGGARLNVENTIVWNNETGVFADSSSSLAIRFSNIQNGFNGDGNINKNPGFVDEVDFSLTPESPCLNRGKGESGYIQNNIIGRHIGAVQKAAR